MINRCKDFLNRYGNLLFFVGGFIFDAMTMVRIDSVLDIALQAVYLLGITILVILQAKKDGGHWVPAGRLERWWEYETELLHFFYGGLLSGYVVFYFKSTSFSRSIIFLSLVALLMIVNEMPQIRRAGSYMRLGLYAFCVVSFLNYLLPVVIGRMGPLIFLVAWAGSVWLTFKMVKKVEAYTPDTDRKKIMRVAPAAVLLAVLVLYFTKLIPPVPLSVQYVGIYRSVEKDGERYKLTYRKPPFTRFWQKSERVFLARPGDRINCFVRVFAPRRFEHHVFVRWSWYDEGRRAWTPQDRIPISVHGGRDDGFRGVTSKEFYEMGRWRISVETDDERVLSVKDFRIESDLSTDPYETRDIWM